MKIKEMSDRELEIFVRKRLNQKDLFNEDGSIRKTTDDSETIKEKGDIFFLAPPSKVEHDRFDFSGYGNKYISEESTESTLFHNSEIIERFRDIGLTPTEENRSGIQSIDAWKGSFSVNGEEEDMGWGTVHLLKELLKRFCSNAEVNEEEFFELLPTKYTAKTINVYLRNKRIVQELKEKSDGNCQLCGFTFKKKDGNNYCESHHLTPLSENGFDIKQNLLILCANCHRKMHYAKVDLSRLDERMIKINDVEKCIAKVGDVACIEESIAKKLEKAGAVEIIKE